MDHNISHDIFRGFISEQTTSLRSSCDDLKEAIKQMADVQDDLMGEVDVAVGQSELLIKQRFKQFATLIDDSEFNRSEKEITLQDLQGFWDIVMIQVDNIKQKMAAVRNRNEKKPSDALKEKPLNGNVKKVPRKVPAVVVPKNTKTASTAGKANIRSHILALRKEMKQKGDLNNDVIFASSEKDKENVESSKESQSSNNCLTVPDVKVFHAGFFSVQSPVRSAEKRNRKLSTKAPESKKRTAVLSSSALKKRILLSPLKHKDYSPFARITRSMKKQMELPSSIKE